LATAVSVDRSRDAFECCGDLGDWCGRDGLVIDASAQQRLERGQVARDLRSLVRAAIRTG
jgi:hypothetical protein